MQTPIIKRGISTVDTINGCYPYKSYGTQFLCQSLDLCRPHAETLFNIEILVNMHLYFQKSVEPFSTGYTCYDLRYFIARDQIFGGSMRDMKSKLFSVFQYLILGQKGKEVDAWRAATPFGTLGDVVMEFKHYKNDWVWPISCSDFEAIINSLLYVTGKENFEWDCNSCWKSKARAVIGKYFTFPYDDDENRHFAYCINYSIANRESSSWEVKIKSEPNETFVDFVIRLSRYNWLTKEGGNHLEQIGIKNSSFYKII